MPVLWFSFNWLSLKMFEKQTNKHTNKMTHMLSFQPIIRHTALFYLDSDYLLSALAPFFVFIARKKTTLKN